MKKLSLLIVIFLSLFDVSGKSQQQRPVIIGYVNSPESSVDFGTFDPGKLTHLIYTFAHIVDNRINLPESDRKYLARFVALKGKTPELKILISVGGWTGDTKEFYMMAEKPENRKIFINSVLEFIDLTKVDGIDLDWEFPGFDWVATGGALSLKPNRPQDLDNYNALLMELRAAFAQKSVTGNKKQYLLTVTTSALSEITQAIDLRNTAKQVNYINIMTYDFYLSWLPLPIFVTGHQSNLFDTQRNPRTISADLIVQYHIKMGVPSNKLVLGIPLGFYNYWSGVNPKCNGLYQFATNTHRYSATEIKTMIANGSLKRFWDSKAKAPYYWDARSKIFASGDDEQSIRQKCKYIKKNQLAGAMFWYYQKDQEKLLNALVSGMR